MDDNLFNGELEVELYGDIGAAVTADVLLQYGHTFFNHVLANTHAIIHFDPIISLSVGSIQLDVVCIVP